MINSVSTSTTCTVPLLNDVVTQPKDSVQAEISDFCANRYSLVFMGYSGKGYKDPEHLVQMLNQLLDEAIEKHGGADKLVVSAGATSCGIGIVYEIAKQKNIATLGIVSALADEAETSGFCDKKVFVQAESWEVKDPNGNSYTLYPATLKGEIFKLGGGVVSDCEIAEAREKRLTYEEIPFEPGPTI